MPTSFDDLTIPYSKQDLLSPEDSEMRFLLGLPPNEELTPTAHDFQEPFSPLKSPKPEAKALPSTPKSLFSPRFSVSSPSGYFSPRRSLTSPWRSPLVTVASDSPSTANRGAFFSPGSPFSFKSTKLSFDSPLKFAELLDNQDELNPNFSDQPEPTSTTSDEWPADFQYPDTLEGQLKFAFNALRNILKNNHEDTDTKWNLDSLCQQYFSGVAILDESTKASYQISEDELLENFLLALETQSKVVAETMWTMNGIDRLLPIIEKQTPKIQSKILIAIMLKRDENSLMKTSFIENYLRKIDRKIILSITREFDKTKETHIKLKKLLLKLIPSPAKRAVNFDVQSTTPEEKSTTSKKRKSSPPITMGINQNWTIDTLDAELNNFLFYLTNPDSKKINSIWDQYEDVFKSFFSGLPVEIGTEKHQIKESQLLYHFEHAVKLNHNNRISEYMWDNNSLNILKLINQDQKQAIFLELVLKKTKMSTNRRTPFLTKYINSIMDKQLLIDWQNNSVNDDGSQPPRCYFSLVQNQINRLNTFEFILAGRYQRLPGKFGLFSKTGDQSDTSFTETTSSTCQKPNNTFNQS